MSGQIQPSDKCAFCGDAASRHLLTVSGPRCEHCACRQFKVADTEGPWCQGRGKVLTGERATYPGRGIELVMDCPGCLMCPAVTA